MTAETHNLIRSALAFGGYLLAIVGAIVYWTAGHSEALPFYVFSVDCFGWRCLWFDTRRAATDPGPWYPCPNGCISNAEHHYAHRQVAS